MKLFPLFLFTAIAAAGCKDRVKCEDIVKPVNDISTDAFGKLPYTGTDTLYFIDEHNDTNIVAGEGKVAYYEETSDSPVPDCFNSVLSQAFRIHFRPLKGNLYFDVWQKVNGKNIVLYNPEWPVNFYINYLNVGEHHPLNMDSLTINKVVYRNVSTATPKDITFNIIDQTYVCYYNQPYGVLLIRNGKENKEYSLIAKP